MFRHYLAQQRIIAIHYVKIGFTQQLLAGAHRTDPGAVMILLSEQRIYKSRDQQQNRDHRKPDIQSVREEINQQREGDKAAAPKTENNHIENQLHHSVPLIFIEQRQHHGSGHQYENRPKSKIMPDRKSVA